jgi:hypothetical protein
VADKDKPNTTLPSESLEISTDPNRPPEEPVLWGVFNPPKDAMEKLAGSAAAGQAAYDRIEGARRVSGISRTPPLPPRLPGGNYHVEPIDKSVRESVKDAFEEHRTTASPPPPPPEPPISRREPSPKPERKFWSYIDKAVLSLFELLALMFGLPFGDDLFHEKPVTNLHLVYLSIGALFAIGGPMFPLVRTMNWIPKGAAISISAAARDARIWIAVLLIFFLYGVAPDLYRRATLPIATTTKPETGFTQQQVDEKIASAVANLNSQLTEANRQKDVERREADAFRQQIQNAPPRPPAPEDQIPVSWQPDFQLNWYAGPKIAWIRFIGVSAALARIKDAYVISTLTGHKEQLDVANATNFGERWKIDQVEPIPSGAQVILVYEPKPPPSLADFMSQWGAFEFHVVYDNKEYVKIYSQDYINSKMTREMPGVFGPRVTPRNDK